MKNTLRSVLFPVILWSLLISGVGYADPPGPPTDHGSSGNQDPEPVGAPIDGGLGVLVLLAAGVGYGGLKMARAFKNKEPEEL